MSVFVTVGSTSFDDLISTVNSPAILKLLASEGFEKLILQIGSGKDVTTNEKSPIPVEWFRIKDSILVDIKSASLVIGHGGAGTIMECLTNNKPLVTVMNEKLMENHQNELSEQLSKENYLLFCKCSELESTLRQYFKNKTLFREFISEPNMFPAFMLEIAGFR